MSVKFILMSIPIIPSAYVLARVLVQYVPRSASRQALDILYPLTASIVTLPAFDSEPLFRSFVFAGTGVYTILRAIGRV